jgi:hypothetical protein
MNIHFKNAEGEHKIIEGDIEMLADKKQLRADLQAQKIHTKKSVTFLGFLKGGQYKAPATIWDVVAQ